ncbi:hypothetical protein GTP91_23720 [Rugamonas sp. FT82W]|uniref:Uncharacterized protein n=1 Tax=Duganella vulcania TaxID=2692166 RepID=A0A845GBD6_9BURK|nr:hypothetical protein [Duganella vulcania]MYM90168.1 hypothetical protein [Duganella vulcania]
MDIISRPLNPVTTSDYLVEVLAQVALVDADTVNRLRNGSVVALAPAAVSDERLHDFVHGGLLKNADSSFLSTTMLEPVENSATNLARQLLRFQGLDCMIQDPLRKIEEAKVQDGEVLLIDGSLFYRSRNCLQSEANCEHGACQIFCVKRGHEIIPKGKFHDRRNDHKKAKEAEGAVPVSG